LRGLLAPAAPFSALFARGKTLGDLCAHVVLVNERVHGVLLVVVNPERPAMSGEEVSFDLGRRAIRLPATQSNF
jgi:hypothetical protein